MRILEIFKRKLKQPTKKAAKKKQLVLNPNQEAVYLSIRKLGECNARMVETDLHWRGGSITPRVAELVRKGYVQKVDHKRGLGGYTVNYYRITGKTPEFQS